MQHGPSTFGRQAAVHPPKGTGRQLLSTCEDDDGVKLLKMSGGYLGSCREAHEYLGPAACAHALERRPIMMSSDIGMAYMIMASSGDLF